MSGESRGKETTPLGGFYPTPERSTHDAPTHSLDSEEEYKKHLGRQLGDYELVSLLGVGGMGAVFLARHILLGREVAVKLLRPSAIHNPHAVQRFFLEARSANDIRHENIVQIFDFKIESPLGPYFVMELLRGKSLEEEIKRGPIDESRSIQIAIQLAKALGAAHEKGIVHRDLKPSNVFLIEAHGQKDIVKILDFGIAKLLGLESTMLKHTNTGEVIGTPYYMSPEQCRGLHVDQRADIYAFGVIFFELLTGRLVFEGVTLGDIIVKHCIEPPPRPDSIIPGISESTQKIILKCLEKRPEDRYQDLTLLIEELSSWMPSFLMPPMPESPALALPGIAPMSISAPVAMPPVAPVPRASIPKWPFFVLAFLVGLLTAGYVFYPTLSAYLFGAAIEAPLVVMPASVAASVPMSQPASAPLPATTAASIQTSSPTKEEISSAPTSAPASIPSSAPQSTPATEPVKEPIKQPNKPPIKKKKFKIPLNE